MRTNILAIIPKMHGIMKAHNVQGRAHGLVQYRRLVCSCETAVCDCLDPITWNPDMQHIEDVDNMEVDEANLDADNIDEPNVDNREAPISSASEGDWVAVSLKAASGRRRVYIGRILTVEDSGSTSDMSVSLWILRELSIPSPLMRIWIAVFRPATASCYHNLR